MSFCVSKWSLWLHKEAAAAALSTGLSVSKSEHMLGEFLYTSTSNPVLTNFKQHRKADIQVRGPGTASIHRNNWNIFKRKETRQYKTYNLKLQGVPLGQTLLFAVIILIHWYLLCNRGSKCKMIKENKCNSNRLLNWMSYHNPWNEEFEPFKRIGHFYEQQNKLLEGSERDKTPWELWQKPWCRELDVTIQEPAAIQHWHQPQTDPTSHEIGDSGKKQEFLSSWTHLD